MRYYFISIIYRNIAIYKSIEMGTTKTDHFTEEQNKIALILKALGHPARVAIIDHLLKVNACIGSDILEEIPLAQPTISQHLKILRSAGLIKGTVEGTATNYCINEKTFEMISGYFTKIALNTVHNDCC